MIFSLKEGLEQDTFKIILNLPDNDSVTFVSMKGSYGIFQARLLNMNYCTYLRMCRDCYGAILAGKEGYPYYFFKKENRNNANRLISLLNERLELALKS